MTVSRFSVPDAERSRLRATVATIERAVARLPQGVGPVEDDGRTTLAAAIADLVDQLALGPEPELRACPNCGRTIMRAATRCGHCWKKLDSRESLVK